MLSAGVILLRCAGRWNRTAIRLLASPPESSGAEANTSSDAIEPDLQLDEIVQSMGTTSMDSSTSEGEPVSFARLLRHSKFVQLGDFDGRVVTGKVVHRVADDLYIDFGLKFNAVCKAPALNNEKYVIGSSVLMRLHDPELSQRFLGSRRDLTLLEADATLIRLYGSNRTSRRGAREQSEGDGSAEEKKQEASS